MNIRKPIIEQIPLSVAPLSKDEAQGIKCINELIECINLSYDRNLLVLLLEVQDIRKTVDKNNNNQLKALVIKERQFVDAENRRNFVEMLATKTNQERLQLSLSYYCQATKQDEDVISAKKNQLDILFEEVKEISDFLYFTAEDLCSIAKLLENLLSVIDYTIKLNGNFKHGLTSKKQDLLTAKEKIKICMKMQLDTCEENKKKIQPNVKKPTMAELGGFDLSESNEGIFGSAIPVTKDGVTEGNNDVLLPIRTSINAIFDRKVMEDQANIWVDTSFCHAIPTVFEELPLQGTVESYFTNYINSPIDPVDKEEKSDYLKYFYDHLNKISNYVYGFHWILTSPVAHANEVIKDVYDWYYNPVDFYLNKYCEAVDKMTASAEPIVDAKSDSAEANSAVTNQEPVGQNWQVVKEAENPESDLNVSQLNIDPPVQVIKEDQPILVEVVLPPPKVLAWQEVINDLIEDLVEKYESMEVSCFSFFYKSKMDIKSDKIFALLQLTNLEKITSLEALKAEAQVLINYPTVTKGFTSRTEEILRLIIADQPVEKLSWKRAVTEYPYYFKM